MTLKGNPQHHSSPPPNPPLQTPPFPGLSPESAHPPPPHIPPPAPPPPAPPPPPRRRRGSPRRGGLAGQRALRAGESLLDRAGLALRLGQEPLYPRGQPHRFIPQRITARLVGTKANQIRHVLPCRQDRP